MKIKYAMFSVLGVMSIFALGFFYFKYTPSYFQRDNELILNLSDDEGNERCISRYLITLKSGNDARYLESSGDFHYCGKLLTIDLTPTMKNHATLRIVFVAAKFDTQSPGTLTEFSRDYAEITGTLRN